MNEPLSLTQRELKEIAHAIHYFRNYGHGTVGHNMLVIIGKMALSRGFELGPTGAVETLKLPAGVVVEDVR